MKRTHPISVEHFDFYLANITACYYQSLQYPTIVDAGLNWYSNANLAAEKMARRHKVDLSLVCGVIAALSPINRWERNLVDADLLIKTVGNGDKITDLKVGTYNHNKEKAWLIALGNQPLEVLRGNKVRSFYGCLLFPNNSIDVCVDSHAINICLGRQARISATPTLTDERYILLSNAYRCAAIAISEDSLETTVTPMQVQGVTWTLYRVLRGIDKAFQI